METPLTADNSAENVASAGDSNLLPFDSRRRSQDGLINNTPHITVFKIPTLRRLLVTSVVAMLAEIVQLICQVCVIMQSKRLSMSAVCAVLVVWTVLALTLTSQWILLLSRNQIDIVKKGKLIVCGCQGLAILSLMASVILLLVQNDDDQWKDDSIKYLVSTIVTCLAFNVLVFGAIFTFILRGQKAVHQVIGSWLWLAIQHHIQTQHSLVEEGGSTIIKEHLQAAYDADRLLFTAGAA